MAKPIATRNQQVVLVDHSPREGEWVVEVEKEVDLQALF
jgi:hypothetical protein